MSRCRCLYEHVYMSMSVERSIRSGHWSTFAMSTSTDQTSSKKGRSNRPVAPKIPFHKAQEAFSLFTPQQCNNAMVFILLTAFSPKNALGFSGPLRNLPACGLRRSALGPWDSTVPSTWRICGAKSSRSRWPVGFTGWNPKSKENATCLNNQTSLIYTLICTVLSFKLHWMVLLKSWLGIK